MNTGKQVNAMIGLLFLTLLIVGAYFVNESTRQEEALEEVTERNAERGARVYVQNCRGCHGHDGLGPEGDPAGFAPKLNSSAFLILNEHNEFGVEATSTGVAQGINTFLFDTIACGRTNTLMPKWSLAFGGSLSDRQITNLVIMITNGRWDLVEHEAEHVDEEAGLTEEERREVVYSDSSALSLTQSNCGQFSVADLVNTRSRDPLAGAGGAATPTPAAGPTVQGVPVADFFGASCAGCHGVDRAGITGLGLPLLPSVLDQPDDFYFDVIANGRPGTAMPAWLAAGLTEDQIRTLVEFITTVEP